MAASPLIMLVSSAIVAGGLATLIVIIAIAVDGWQDITFDDQVLRSINATSSAVTVVSLSDSTQLYKVSVKTAVDSANSSTTDYLVHSSTNGLWQTCDHLSDEERSRYATLIKGTLTIYHCFVFVTQYDEDDDKLTLDARQIARLHNSAASCYIVVIIDLTSAIVVGLVGILHKQVASCMVTGVLYFMAALFSMFGLAMFHTKHYYETYFCKSFDPMPDDICNARNVDILYAVPLAWVGVIMCLLACGLWLVFARALRVILGKTML